MMSAERYDVVIVGSGAGGATLARDLSRKGRRVLVIERGRLETQLGTFRDAVRYYDNNPITRVPQKSSEGVILWHTHMAGGSTMVACCNLVRSQERTLAELGVTLDAEFAAAEDEIGISPLDDRLMSPGSRRLQWAADELGYHFQPMPKCIMADRCRQCGQCTLGCRHDAHWSALDYLRDATDHGAEVWYETLVEEVVISNGRATGVRAQGKEGRVEVGAAATVLAAGGLGTPVILQQSGIRTAGEGLFIDTLVNTYGVTRDLNQIHEPQMALVDLEFHAEKGFLLSPYVNHARMVRFIELGARGMALPDARLLGIMTKIADEPVGRVFPDGSVSKPVTPKDQQRINAGTEVATAILVKAGADARSIVTTRPSGAHPGGTAAIGRVVDSDLQTEVDGLFVCDASVLPTAPGLPPILTIVALAKRLAKTLAA